VNHRIGIPEMLAIAIAVGIGQVAEDNVRNRMTTAAARARVEWHELVTLGERVIHALRDITCGTGQHYTPFRHGCSPFCQAMVLEAC
jgi:hypothetical protein